MNVFSQSSEQQLFETESECSSHYESQFSHMEDSNKEQNELRQTIYNRSNLIKQHMLNRQKQSELNIADQNQCKLNLSIIKGEQHLIYASATNTHKVSLADVGRVYEKTNYAKWLNNIQQEEIYLDPTKKKQNRDMVNDLGIDQQSQSRAMRSQSNVSEYYNRKLSMMNDQLRVMKDKILREQIQIYNKQLTMKGSNNGLKEMTQQLKNQKAISDYSDEILIRCNRVDSYFTYKKNHNFLPKRAATSFSFANPKNNQKQIKSTSQNAKRIDDGDGGEIDNSNKSTINSKSIIINSTLMTDQHNGQNNSIGTFEDMNQMQPSAVLKQDQNESIQNSSSIYSSLIRKKQSTQIPISKQQQRSQSQNDKFLDADFTLSPIKEKASQIVNSNSNCGKLPQLKNDKYIQPDKHHHHHHHHLKGFNQKKSNSQQSHYKDISISPPSLSPNLVPQILRQNNIGPHSPNFGAQSPSQKSIQAPEKKGSRLAYQIERKINKLKKIQRMSSFHVNEGSPFQYGSTMLNFQDSHIERFNQNSQVLPQFQSPVLNKGIFPNSSSSLQLGSNNKPRVSRQQAVGDKNDFQIGHVHQFNLSQQLIKEEDENEDNFNNFILDKKSGSKRGSVNLLEQPISKSKTHKMHTVLKSQCSINLQEDKQKVTITENEGGGDQGNEIHLIRRGDPAQRHKSGIQTEQSEFSFQQDIGINSSNSNSPLVGSQNKKIKIGRTISDNSPRSPNKVNFQHSTEMKCNSTVLNVSDMLNKSVQMRQRSTTYNNGHSPMLQHQTSHLLTEETHKIKEQLPDITNQLIKGIEEEYGQIHSVDLLFLFYSQLQQIIQIEINDIEQNLRFKYDRILNERKKMLNQKLTNMKAMQNVILSCSTVDNEIKTGNKQIDFMKKKQIGQIKNIEFYYEILQQHDFPNEEIGKVILQMKQLEQIRDQANANQFVKDYRFNTVNNQIDSNLIVMQADRQDRVKRVKQFNQSRRISQMQKLQ